MEADDEVPAEEEVLPPVLMLLFSELELSTSGKDDESMIHTNSAISKKQKRKENYFG